MTRRCPALPRQTGLSMVEMMVALGVGLLLTVIIGYMLFGSVMSYRTQGGSARVQESSRFAMDQIGRDITQAGFVYISSAFAEVPQAFSGTPISGEDDATITIRAAERKAGTDYVRLSFDGSVDCQGNAVSGTPVVNEYYVNDQDQLMCAVDPAAPGQPVADGVEDLQLTYGIDSNADDTIDRYTEDTATLNWGQVLAVQVCMVVVSSQDGVISQAQPYQDCAGATHTPTDRRLRRNISSTIQLRNRGA